MVSAILAGLGTIATVALSVGLSKLADHIDEIRVPEKLRSVNILREINSALTQIRHRSLDAYNKAVDELGAVSKRYGGSANYQSFLRMVKGKLNAKSQEKRAHLEKVEDSVNTISSEASQLANMSDSYRAGSNAEKDLENIRNQIKSLDSFETSMNNANNNNKIK